MGAVLVLALGAGCGGAEGVFVVHARLADAPAVRRADARVAPRALGDEAFFVRTVAQRMPAHLEWRTVLPGGAPALALRASAAVPEGLDRSAVRLRVVLRAREARATLLDRRLPRAAAPARRERIDLSRFAGREVVLSFQAEGPAGAEALWGDPTLLARRPAGRPNVIVVCMDTLRRDHVDGYGGEAGLTPAIRHLAGDGVRFEVALASAPWTLPSVSTVLTGLDPSVHGAGRRVTIREGATPEEFERLRESERGFVRFDDGEIYRLSALRPQVDTLAERLGGPYVTHAVNSNVNLSPVGNVINQGFGSFVDRHLQRAEDVTRHAVGFARAHRDELFFLYVHYMEPHEWERWGAEHGPRRLRLGSRERARRRYAGLVRDGDRQVGRLLAALRRMGLYDDALVVFFSDHGEHFWDDRSGRIAAHGATMHNLLLRVPLVVKFPGGALTGSVVPNAVKLADIFRTVVEEADLAAGAPLPDGLVSLRRAAAHGLPERAVVSEFNVRGPELVAVELGGLKLVHALRLDTWSLRRADSDLSGGELDEGARDAGRRLRTILEAHLRHREEMPPTLPMEVDAEAWEQLRALGYIQ